MKRTTLYTPRLFNPGLLWFDYAAKTAEMLLSSGFVINNRVTRMAKAGHSPSARDRKEFLLMGTEKAQAAQESMLAVYPRMAAAGMAMMMGAWRPTHALHESARIAHAALAPIHRKATANARRLSGATRAAKRSLKGL